MRVRNGCIWRSRRCAKTYGSAPNDEGKNAALKHTLLITGSDGYAVSVALGELDPNFANTQVLLAYDGADGKASFDHLRLVVPGDVHGGRSVKDVVGIEVK